MQQTSLDHWLKNKLVNFHQVYCNVLPNDLPPRLVIEEAPEGSAGARYRLSPRNEKMMNEVVDQFRMQSITYSMRVEERTGMLARMVNRPRHSFTYDAIWAVIALSGVVTGAWFAWQLVPAGDLMNSMMAFFTDLKADLLN